MVDQEQVLDIMKTEMEDKVMEMEQKKLEAVEQIRAEAEEETRTLKLRYQAIKTQFALLKPGILRIAQEYRQLRKLAAQFPTLLKNAIQHTKEEVRCPVLSCTVQLRSDFCYLALCYGLRCEMPCPQG